MMAFMKKPMTVEEFRDALNDLVSQVEDPNSEVNEVLAEGALLVSDLRQFDAVLADKTQALFDSVSGLVEYVKSRKEIKQLH